MHPLIAKAQLDANRFQIRKASDWGFILWRQSDHSAWKWFQLAHMNDRSALEEIACEKLARLTED